MEFTNRATKTYYNNFIKAIEKIATINMLEKSAAYKSQLGQLEINLKNIKKFEVGLDVSELENQYNSFKNAIDGNDTQKSLDKDLIIINTNFEILFKKLNETKLNFDAIDLQVKSATEPLERDVKIFENKYPNFDSIVFHQKINDFQTKFRALLEGTSSKNVSDTNFKNDYQKTTHKPHFSIWTLYPDYQKPVNLYEPLYQYKEHDIEAFYKILEDYKNGFDTLMENNDMDALNALYVDEINSGSRVNSANRLSFEEINIKNFIKSHVAKIDVKRVKILQEELNEIKIDFEVDDYFNTLTEAEYWIGASKLHPTISELESISNEYKILVSLFGSLENYRNRIKENRKKLAKKVFLPKAITENSEIEAYTKQAFENKGWNEEVLKIHLLSPDWRLERNSELIIGRVFNVAIASKKQDGDCLLYIATIRQEQVGDGFATPFLESFNNNYIAEENI